MRKLFAVAALVVATFLVAPSAALAGGGGYEPRVAPGSVSEGTVAFGGTVEFCGDGFAPNSDVTITDRGEDRGTFETDAEGALCVQLTLTGAGNHVLTMSGFDADGNPLVVTAVVRVTASNAAAPVRNGSGNNNAGSGNSSGSRSTLARTGAEGTATQVWAGIGLLGLGAGLVALTVSRRKTPPSAA